MKGMICNECSNKFDSCGHNCHPARYGCEFDVQANPFDASVWNVTLNGATTRVKIPKLNETDTKLSANFSSASLIYNAEKHTDILTGAQLGGLISLKDLRDLSATNANSCDLLVYHPYCSECGEGCSPKDAKWEAYHIPSTSNTATVDSDGYYHVLGKTDCGCIEEMKLPVVPSGMISLDYMRDSVPDDPDFPWYYGCYNDTINLHLADNAPQYFNKYALKVTVNYGVQCILSEVCPNYNFRSLVVPVIAGQEIDVQKEASILQGFCGYKADGERSIPWGSQSLRGSFSFLVPKGKEAYLHHEWRIRTGGSFPNYYTGAWDGQKVPAAETQLNTVLHPASRLHALQVIIEPTVGASNFTPSADPVRDQLDAPVDAYPNPYA